MPLCFHILVITSNYFLVYFINNASMDNLALHQVRGIREVQSLVASGGIAHLLQAVGKALDASALKNVPNTSETQVMEQIERKCLASCRSPFDGYQVPRHGTAFRQPKRPHATPGG